MVPILILQVILLPFSAGWIMSGWSNSRMQTELQNVANNIGSAIEQVYLSVNRGDILPGTITTVLNVPPTIESYLYSATGQLKTANATKILYLYFVLQGSGKQATTMVTLGPNVAWQSSAFRSNSNSPYVGVQKAVNGTLTFYFG